MSDEIKKEPVVESKAPEELSAEELNNVNGGGFLQTLGEVIKEAQGGDEKVEYFTPTLHPTLISGIS
jgi:bacteriocin-like protein